jgi:hypothetical protein
LAALGGFYAGTALTWTLARKVIKADEKFAVRQSARFNEAIKKLGPYAPREVLEDLLTYIQFEAIMAEEKL